MKIVEIKQGLLKLSKVSPNIIYSYDLTKMLSASENETKTLINDYYQAHPAEYLLEMMEFDKLNGKQIPDRRRAFIFVPCFNEEKNLESLVEQYAAQKDFSGNELDKDLFEVCFVVNFPENEHAITQKSYEKRFEESIDILLKEKEKHQNIHIISKSFKLNLGSLGRARKYGMDYCLYRISKHPARAIDFTLILSNEGDTINIPQTYIASYLNFFANGSQKFVQGKIEYPKELLEAYEPIRLFTGCREAVHLGQGIYNKEFPFFDGIMPIGRNFGVSPRIYVKAGGIDPIRRDDTDDDMNFGTDIHANIGEHVKTFFPIELITNPRREVMIIRDILAGKQEDAKKSYENFHSNRAIYDLSYSDILDMVKISIPKSLKKEEQCPLLNHYFQWIIGSRYKATFYQLPGFSDIIDRHRSHKISFWEKESQLCYLFENYLSGFERQERQVLEKNIVTESLSWFNHFISGFNLYFTCTFEGLKSSLKNH